MKANLEKSVRSSKQRLFFAGLILMCCLVGLFGLTHLHMTPSRYAEASVEELGGRLGKSKVVWIPVINNGWAYGQHTHLVLNKPTITDADLIPVLDNLGSLTNVEVDACAITDETLRHLEGKTLRTLSLMNTLVTDRGMASIATCSSFRMLDLSGTQVSDTGLSRWKGLTRLARLDLSDTKITDAGLTDFARAGSVTDVILIDSHVTPAGIAEALKINQMLKIF